MYVMFCVISLLSTSAPLSGKDIHRAIYKSPETVRFSKLESRKYLELLGEKGKRLAVGGVQENSGQGPFEWKTVKACEVWEQDTQIEDLWKMLSLPS